MNKLLTFPGLQPVYLGDIDFLQESVRSAFVQLLRGLTGQVKPNCMLVAPTPNADGVICINGEIMPCKYYSGAINGVLSYKVESSYSGDRVFKNGVNHQCYESRYAVGYNAPVGTQTYKDFKDLLFESVKPSSGGNRASNDNVTVEISYLYSGGNLHLEGTLDVLNSADDVEMLIEDMRIAIPGAFYLKSPWYFTITADIDGALTSIPAKMIIRKNDDSSCLVSIYINKSPIVLDTSGSFSFTLIK